MRAERTSSAYGKRRMLPLALMMGSFLVIVGWWWRESRLESAYDEPIRIAAARYNVDPALVKAIVWQESRFNPNARGRAQEIGLMQLREEAAQEWADAEQIEAFVHEHCLDPLTNTLAGTYYLAKVMKRYSRADNPVPYGLADYNAGRANVLKWNKAEAATNSAAFVEQIGFPGTKEYVKAVMLRTRRYNSIFSRPLLSGRD